MKEKAFNPVFHTPTDKSNTDITSPFYMLTFSASYFNQFCNGLDNVCREVLGLTVLLYLDRPLSVGKPPTQIRKKWITIATISLINLEDKDSKYFTDQDDIQIKGCVKHWTRL